jgi:hypothetical protein
VTGKIVQLPEVGGLHLRYLRPNRIVQHPRSSLPRNVRDRSASPAALPRSLANPVRQCTVRRRSPVSGPARAGARGSRIAPSEADALLARTPANRRHPRAGPASSVVLEEAR